MGNDYLNQYCEFRYLQIIGSFHKLTQQFYRSENLSGVMQMRDAIATVTRMDHLNVHRTGSGNFSVNSALTNPSAQMLENSNFFQGSITPDSVSNFKRCIRPVINEKALEPPEVTLFQSIYQQDLLRRSQPTQFTG